MEKTQITEVQEQELLKHFTKRRTLGIVFFIIGILGYVPIGITFFDNTATSFYTSPSAALFIIGIMFLAQSNSAISKIKKNDYQVYKTTCKKVGSLGHAVVENNEVLSKKVKKPLKRIELLGSTKSIQADNEIGIVQVNKDFWAFSL